MSKLTRPHASTVLLAATPGNAYILDSDVNGDGQLDTQSSAGAATTYPSWLKLVRSGTTFTGYYSTDNVHWTLVGATTVSSAAANQDVGITMTSQTMFIVDVDDSTITAARPCAGRSHRNRDERPPFGGGRGAPGDRISRFHASYAALERRRSAEFRFG